MIHLESSCKKPFNGIGQSTVVPLLGNLGFKFQHFLRLLKKWRRHVAKGTIFTEKLPAQPIDHPRLAGWSLLLPENH